VCWFDNSLGDMGDFFITWKVLLYSFHVFAHDPRWISRD